MQVELSKVVEHVPVRAGYHLLRMAAPDIAATTRPGQFVHLEVPGSGERILRRPISIYRAENGCVSILYKVVGRGTAALSRVAAGEDISLLGPLGEPFPELSAGATPLLVAGGYGVAPLYQLAKTMARTGMLFVGGRTADDILLTEEFEAIGWDVRVATEDGSMGETGRVTVPLDAWLAEHADETPEGYACGPDGLLKAVGERSIAGEWNSWLSLDRHMGCGVGACLTCVHRMFDDEGASYWARVCKEGPVFESRQIDWDGQRALNRE